jgi:NAD(P)-dependent dehydrogenase (short-subunit alcohol dehydrogenase family)
MGDRLKDKVALVSGVGSSGLRWGNGKAMAVLFTREGAKVLAADINRDTALETKRIMLAVVILGEALVHIRRVGL